MSFSTPNSDEVGFYELCDLVQKRLIGFVFNFILVTWSIFELVLSFFLFCFFVRLSKCGNSDLIMALETELKWLVCCE